MGKVTKWIVNHISFSFKTVLTWVSPWLTLLITTCDAPIKQPVSDFMLAILLFRQMTLNCESTVGIVWKINCHDTSGVKIINQMYY